MKRNLLKTPAETGRLQLVDPAALAAITAGEEPVLVELTGPEAVVSNVLKTRHDTIKNSIGNIL